MTPFSSGERHVIRGRSKSIRSVESEKQKIPKREGRTKDSRQAKSQDHAVFPPSNAATSVTITNPSHAVMIRVSEDSSLRCCLSKNGQTTTTQEAKGYALVHCREGGSKTTPREIPGTVH